MHSSREEAETALGTVSFRRSPDGTVVELSVKQDRVWDLRFQRAH